MYYFLGKTSDGYWYYFKSKEPIRNIKQAPVLNTKTINSINIFEYYKGKFEEWKANKQ